VPPTLLFPGLGLLLVALGWPLANRRVGPNRWYGLRVPATFADERVWYDANASMGRDLMAMGVVLALVAVILPLVLDLAEATYTMVCAGILAAGSVVLTIRGLRGANRLQRQRRGSSGSR
jgi:uncharacterized membrane protein